MNQKTTIVIGLILYLAAAVGSYSFFSGQTIATNYRPPVEESKGSDENGGPKTEACPLNGALYSKAQREKWESRRPLGIAVENSVAARPQSGLNSADIVYEAVAEYGITRFLGIFYCENPEIVGPVRSARIYFIRLLQGYGKFPLYAHVGGANAPGPTDALGEIRDLGWANYNDLNQFSVPFPNYWRDYDRLPGVDTEHTVYTDTNKLWSYAEKTRKLTNVDEEGTAWDESFTPWKFKKEAGKPGNVTAISYGFWDQSVSSMGVAWKYDAEKKAYLRTNGGAPHLDKNTEEQIYASNVVVMFAKETAVDNGLGHMLYDLTSGGDALIFMDGRVVEAHWEKPDYESPITFTADGKEVEFSPGRVWVSILPIGNKVDY
jgi:hypothetical protein